MAKHRPSLAIDQIAIPAPEKSRHRKHGVVVKITETLSLRYKSCHEICGRSFANTSKEIGSVHSVAPSVVSVLLTWKFFAAFEDYCNVEISTSERSRDGIANLSTTPTGRHAGLDPASSWCGKDGVEVRVIRISFNSRTNP